MLRQCCGSTRMLVLHHRLCSSWCAAQPPAVCAFQILPRSSDCYPRSALPPLALLALQEFDSTACLEHLPAWPDLQALLLYDVQPSDILDEHVPLLAAAPHLRRLAFCYRVQPSVKSGASQAAERAQEDRLKVRLARGARCPAMPPWQEVRGWDARRGARHTCGGQRVCCLLCLAAGPAAGAWRVRGGVVLSLGPLGFLSSRKY